MNIWANAVITQKGLALQSKLISGTTLNITKVQIGAGYTSPVLLPQQEEIIDVKKTLSAVTGISYPEQGKCAININITNDDIDQGFTAKQIGIFANDLDEGEILYFIAQAENEAGTIVPSKTEMPGYSAEWTFYFQYGQADNVIVQVDPSNTVSRNDMETYVAQELEGFLKSSGGTITGDITIESGNIKTHQTGIQFDGINKYAVLNDQEFFPSTKTILQYANGCDVSTSVMIVQDNYPTDAPAQVEAHLFILVGTGSRKTVVFMPYNNASIPTYMRDIFNSTWNENNWRSSGGFAQETADDLHTITECKTVQCYSNTLNTPYKEGLTNAAHGVCIVAATGAFRSLVYIATSSNSPIWYQACVNGTWGKWVRVSYAGVFKDNALYVGPTGNDTTGDGTNTAPYASLTKALSVIPKDLGGQTITINVAGGTYIESNVGIDGFYGGRLRIIGEQNNHPVFTQGITVYKSEAQITFQYIDSRCTESRAGFVFSSAQDAQMNDCVITGDGTGNGIFSYALSSVHVYGCTVNNANVALCCERGHMYVAGAQGTDNKYAAVVGYGGIINIDQSLPAYTVAAYFTICGGRIYRDAQTNIPKY